MKRIDTTTVFPVKSGLLFLLLVPRSVEMRIWLEAVKDVGVIYLLAADLYARTKTGD